MTRRPPLVILAVLVLVFSAIVVFPQKDGTKSQTSTSSARGGGGKPSPTPTPTPTPTPGCATVVANTNSWAGSGGLDTSFGNGGIATLKISPPGSTAQVTFDSALQADGKVVTVGTVRNPATLGMDGFVIRFNVDGSIDTSFGSPDPTNPGSRLGYLLIDNGSDTGEDIRSLAIDTAGRIVLAFEPEMPLVRLTPDGDLDPTFGTGGSVFATIPNLSAEAVRLQANGQIIVGGSYSGAFVAARFNEDGSLDTSFGDGGYASTSIIGNGNGRADVYDIELQSVDGEERIVFGGWEKDKPNGPWKFAILRLRNDGSPDASFSNGGIVLTRINGSFDRVTHLAIDQSNRIIAVGLADGPCGYDAAVARYLVDGSLDTTFSGDGKLTLDTYGGDNGFYDVVVQPDGKIVALGHAKDAAQTNRDAVVARFNSDGTLDSSFGPTTLGGGIVTTYTETQDITFGGLGLLQDGRIVATWSRGLAGETAVSRYLP